MGANADKEKKEDDMEVDTEAPTETEKTEKTEKTATEAKETTAQTAIEGKEGKPAVAQVWGEDEEERPRKVTYAALKERFGEYFMPEEDLAKAMKAIGLAHADETAMADDEEAAQPLTSISPEVEWLAELPELMEDVTPTATLKIQGMRLPFSRMLLKKSLERPSKFNEALVDGETYQVVSDTVFVTYPNVDTARRQCRRVDGMQWPKIPGAPRLQVSYVQAEDVAAYVEEHKAKGDEQEALLRKMAEDQIARNVQPVIAQRFPKTTVVPRLFYSFESNEGAINRAREEARRRLSQMV